MRKYMTFCENCNTEIKKHEWRNHILSEDYLESTGESYCEFWKMSYYNSISSEESQIFYERGAKHRVSDVLKKICGD